MRNFHLSTGRGPYGYHVNFRGMDIHPQSRSQSQASEVRQEETCSPCTVTLPSHKWKVSISYCQQRSTLAIQITAIDSGR